MTSAAQPVAGLTPTQSMILQLQRTAGNAAVNALLRQYRSAGTAQLPPAQRAVTSIQNRAGADADSLGAPPQAEPTPSRESPAMRPKNTVIQRKLSFKPDDFKALVSTKAALTNSVFAQVSDEYAKYLKAGSPAKEAKVMHRMRRLALRASVTGKTPKAENKKKLLRSLTAEIKVELPSVQAKIHKQHLCEDIGLPAAYLDTWSDEGVTLLGEASKALGRGDIPSADHYLTLLRARIGDIVDLIKSTLLSHHIGKVDPEMAKVLGDPNYEFEKDDAKQKKNEADKALNHIQDLADKRNPATTEKQHFGKAYKDMAGTAASNQNKAKSQKIKGLSPAEATAIFGYTTPLYGEYNNPLRKDLGTKKFGKDERALTKAGISGLNKAEAVKAKVFRHTGIFAGYKELNQQGATVSDMGFQSSTKTQAFAATAAQNHDVLEIIESKTGRDVADMSNFPEGEVLFKPGTRFQITKRFDMVQGTTTWNPPLDTDAAKYLAADMKKALVQIIVFKQEL